MLITENSVLIMRGRIARQPNDTNMSVFVINEAPRMLLVGGS
jgi:hypothetical protein